MKIAITDDYQNVALKMGDWKRLGAKAEITVFDRHLGSVDQCTAALQDFEVLCIMRERMPMPRAMFEGLPNLKLLITTGPRNLSIDLVAAKEHGVTVCFTEGSKTLGSTTEIAWSLILMGIHNLAVEEANMRAGRWQTSIGFSLPGRTLGLLGLGKLGSRMAAIGRAFGMNVIAWSQNLTDEKAEAAGAKRVSKDELFAQSDVLSVHTILSDRTRGIIGAAELAAMKNTAWLINTSRGPIIDEAALIAALQAKSIGGAGLDVYNVEPLPADHILRSLDNVVLSPHLGYVCVENYADYYRDMVDDIEAYAKGAPVRVLQG